MTIEKQPGAAGETASADAGVDTPMNVDSVEDVAAGLMAAATEATEPEVQPEVQPEVPEVKPEESDDSDGSDDSDDSGESDESDDSGESDDSVEMSIKDLPEDVRERVQGIIDRRIGQVVKQRKTLEQELELAESRARRAEEQRAEFEQKLTEADEVPMSAHVDPVMLADESKVDAYDKHLAKMEALAIENWDGYEDDQGNSWSAQDVRKKYQAIREQRERVIPQARETARQRSQFEQAARQIHPEMFDRTTEEGKAVNAYLRGYPQLMAIPNIHMILGDAIKYERLRAEERKKAKGPKKAGKNPPPAPSPSSTPPPPRPSGPAPTMADFSKVVESGGNDPDAIAEAVASLS